MSNTTTKTKRKQGASAPQTTSRGTRNNPNVGNEGNEPDVPDNPQDTSPGETGGPDPSADTTPPQPETVAEPSGSPAMNANSLGAPMEPMEPGLVGEHILRFDLAIQWMVREADAVFGDLSSEMNSTISYINAADEHVSQA